MQAVLCDNCQKVAGDQLKLTGWRKLVRFTVHNPEDDGGPQNPLQAMLGHLGGGRGPGAHLDAESEHDLCSDACVVAFIQNGYQSSIQSFADGLSPEDFADTAVPPPDDAQA